MEQKKRKNFLGYDQDTMSTSKPRSKYFVYAALLFSLAVVIIGQPIVTANWSDVAYIIGSFAGLVILAQFVSYIIRIFVKGSSDNGNKFDYFAAIFLIIAILALLTKLEKIGIIPPAEELRWIVWLTFGIIIAVGLYKLITHSKK